MVLVTHSSVHRATESNEYNAPYGPSNLVRFTLFHVLDCSLLPVQLRLMLRFQQAEKCFLEVGMGEVQVDAMCAHACSIFEVRC